MGLYKGYIGLKILGAILGLYRDDYIGGCMRVILE